MQADQLDLYNRYRAIRRVLLIVLGTDLLLAASKGSYGYLTGSLGMLSDGFHSAVHALGGVIGLIGVKLAARPPDIRHPYGYERYEPLAAMGVAVLMSIAYEGIVSHSRTELKVGGRYMFLPRYCMLQSRHSGVISFLAKRDGVLTVRVEGIWIA